jgi:hypothetical protein
VITYRVMGQDPKLDREAFRRWGAKGGMITARKRTAKERSEAARKAVLVRWAKAKKRRSPT